MKEIRTKPEGVKPKVLNSASKIPKAAMKDLWLKSKEKTISEVKGAPFSGQQGETSNAPANSAGDQMLSGMEASVKKGVNLTYRGGKKLAQTTARKIQEKREVSRNLSEIKSTGRNVISESKNIGGEATQSIQKTASAIRSKNLASKVIKRKPQKAVKTVNRSVKGVKQGAKSIKTALRFCQGGSENSTGHSKSSAKNGTGCESCWKNYRSRCKNNSPGSGCRCKSHNRCLQGIDRRYCCGGLGSGGSCPAHLYDWYGSRFHIRNIIY